MNYNELTTPQLIKKSSQLIGKLADKKSRGWLIAFCEVHQL